MTALETVKTIGDIIGTVVIIAVGIYAICSVHSFVSDSCKTLDENTEKIKELEKRLDRLERD